MINPEEVYRIGVIGKAHGIKGEVSMHFTDDVFDRVDADYLIIEVDGILVPFFIEEYRFRSDETIILKLEDINTQERARELTGCDVYFHRHLASEDEEVLTLAFLVGFDVLAVPAESQTAGALSGKRIGTIAAVDDSTQNILFELEDGRLIPANDDLISHIDQERRQIVMQLPEGLLEL